MKYQVIVGNIGTAHDGNNKKVAQKHYKDYVNISKEPFGRASGEQVSLIMNGEPIMDYIPEIDIID